jgi:dTDP-4-dehydrorhamnose reductase
VEISNGVTSPIEICEALAAIRPFALVNLIGATNVDSCEVQPELAWQGNVHSVEVIANALELLKKRHKVSCHLIQISTDQVYSGPGPHQEAIAHPINVYGLSKFTGELIAMRVNATVIRTNFVGRSRTLSRVSLSDWLVDSLRRCVPITVFSDVVFSAVHVDTLCGIIEQCIEKQPIGVFNFGSKNNISKADFAFKLANFLGLPTSNLASGSQANSLLKARRPPDMSLDTTKIERTLGITCPLIEYEIEKTSLDYTHEYNNIVP